MNSRVEMAGDQRENFASGDASSRAPSAWHCGFPVAHHRKHLKSGSRSREEDKRPAFIAANHIERKIQKNANPQRDQARHRYAQNEPEEIGAPPDGNATGLIE